GVPPGSRVTTGSQARPSSSHCARRATCVLLPEPSMPSNVTKRPLKGCPRGGTRRPGNADVPGLVRALRRFLADAGLLLRRRLLLRLGEQLRGAVLRGDRG